MTVDEIKGILNTISNAIETVGDEYSKETSDQIRAILSQLNPTTIAILASVLKLDADKLTKDVANIGNILDGMDSFFLTDEAQKVNDFCNNLANRPVVLKILGWYMG